MNKDIKQKLKVVEEAMQAPDFWNDKHKAQEILAEYQHLKAEAAGEGEYDRGNAIVTILAGAGGLDSEDFAYMLTQMYYKYISDKGWTYMLLHDHPNDHGGYKNITFEIDGKGAYGRLKHESGVHRLVRVSPFNAKQQRHTSFAMVEVVPKLEKLKDIAIPEDELDVSFARSSGPGGQNVNKRETAVRITHKPTGITVHAHSERSQAQNKEKALEILHGKIYKKREEDRKKEERGMAISSDVQAEWGNQIRSYVLHPYKMVKDHRTSTDVHDVENVLDGDIDVFIDAMITQESSE